MPSPASDLTGRNAIITGGGRGLGLEIAKAYLGAGASVFICGRDAGTLASAVEQLNLLAKDDQQVLSMVADIADPATASELVGRAISSFGDLHILVSNAGIYGPKGPTESVDWQEWSRAVAINLFGSVLITRAVLPHFKERRYGKILQLSGGGATQPMPNLSAYAASKAAVVRFAETVAEECRGQGIDVNAIAPGPLNTRMLDEIIEAGPERVGDQFYQRALQQAADGGTPFEQVAKLTLFLGSERSDGVTGKLISAMWDPWQSLPDLMKDLNGSDIYTLRRIVPADRGLDWDT